MTSKYFNGFGVVAAALAMALAGCASTPPQDGQASRAPSTPVEPSPRLESQAMAFESFMRRARDIDADFSGPGKVAQALQVGAAHEPNQLTAGMIAYAALAALQEPSFVAGVRRAGRDRDLARSLAGNPMLAAELPGAEAAAGRAATALTRQGEALGAQGRKVKLAAYSVQHRPWSRARTPDPTGRLARVKRLSTVAYRPEPADAARLRSALAEGGRRGGAASPVVARGLALAALSVLGQEDRGRPLMSEPRAGMCLRLAKLNLYQCLASAGPHYEDIFCLGQHAMIDPAQCVVDAAKPPVSRRTLAAKTSYRR